VSGSEIQVKTPRTMCCRLLSVSHLPAETSRDQLVRPPLHLRICSQISNLQVLVGLLHPSPSFSTRPCRCTLQAARGTGRRTQSLADGRAGCFSLISHLFLTCSSLRLRGALARDRKRIEPCNRIVQMTSRHSIIRSHLPFGCGFGRWLAFLICCRHATVHYGSAAATGQAGMALGALVILLFPSSLT
jgi:hypothetical protein